MKNEPEIIEIKNQLGDTIELKQPTDLSQATIKKYKEVFITNASLVAGNITQIGAQIANSKLTLAQLLSQAPNGLFSATTNPSNLSKFANGTTSTIVKNSSGQIMEHAGFTNVSLNSALNPAMVLQGGMQAMSMISGTYYLHQLNNQIKEIDQKLEELINIHHDSNIGKLIASGKGLSEISNRKHVDLADISAIREFKKTAREIFEEYKFSYKRKSSDLINEKNKKKEEELLNDINFNMSTAFEASKLFLFAETMEIGSRMKLNNQIEIIRELTAQLQKNYEDSFYANFEYEISSLYATKQKQTQAEIIENQHRFDSALESLFKPKIIHPWGILGEYIYKTTKTAKNYHDVQKSKKRFSIENLRMEQIIDQISQKKQLNSLDEVVMQIVEVPNIQAELIYLPADNQADQRVFIPAVS